MIAGDLTADVIVTGGDSDSRRLAFSGFGQVDNQGRDWSAEAVLNWSPKGPLGVVAGTPHATSSCGNSSICRA